MRVAVVGGGISGLAAAWELRERAEVTLFEPARLGGCIRTSDMDGVIVEEGPDAFLTRVPDGLALCEELGIASELVEPAAGMAALWWAGKLRPLPPGTLLGVPRSLTSLARSGLLSPLGILRASADLVLPRSRLRGDETVRELVTRRYGRQVADRLVDPLVGGIHAGWTGELGAFETVPQLVKVAEASRSMTLGLRRLAPPLGPVFAAPRGGLGTLVDTLWHQLETAGTQLVTEAVERVEVVPGGSLSLLDGLPPFDGAVLATPSWVTAGLLGGKGLVALKSLPWVSVAIVTAVTASLTLPAGLSGFLVPRAQGRLMTACSFASSKWPHRSPPGVTVVRISTGRRGEEEALSLDDDALCSRLLGELGEVLGMDVSPSQVKVSRWPRSFPQYLPGHASRVDQARRQVLDIHPGIALAGSSYSGSGIPACIASGRAAARAVLAYLEEGPARPESPSSLPLL